MTKEQIVYEISTRTEPGRMTLEEAEEFYVYIKRYLENMIEAVRLMKNVGME